MDKTKLDGTNLRKYYKYVFKCSKCGVRYGEDSDEVKVKICPNCEAPKFPGKRKKK